MRIHRAHPGAPASRLAMAGILLAGTPFASPQPQPASKVLLENEQVVVTRVTIPPGSSSPMHSHARPSLEIFLTDDHIRETLPDGTAREWKSQMNEVAWIAPVRHRVENLRPAATEIIAMEFKSLPPAAATTATSPSAAEFENEWIKVTHGKLGPKQRGPMHTHAQYIGIFLTDANLRGTLADGTAREISGKRGDASWRAPVRHSIENLADAPFEAIDVNLKTPPGKN